MDNPLLCRLIDSVDRQLEAQARWHEAVLRANKGGDPLTLAAQAVFDFERREWFQLLEQLGERDKLGQVGTRTWGKLPEDPEDAV